MSPDRERKAPEYFPKRPDAVPKIYAYEDTNPQYEELPKVGYTTGDVRERRAAWKLRARSNPVRKDQTTEGKG